MSMTRKGTKCGNFTYEKMVLRVRKPAWRNWQTRWTQNPVIARSCGFEPLRRQGLWNTVLPGEIESATRKSACAPKCTKTRQNAVYSSTIRQQIWAATAFLRNHWQLGATFSVIP